MRKKNARCAAHCKYFLHTVIYCYGITLSVWACHLTNEEFVLLSWQCITWFYYYSSARSYAKPRKLHQILGNSGNPSVQTNYLWKKHKNKGFQKTITWNDEFYDFPVNHWIIGSWLKVHKIIFFYFLKCNFQHQLQCWMYILYWLRFKIIIGSISTKVESA